MSCNLHFERGLRKTGVEIIAGVDEAGRGALAGPVTAAAVILPPRFRHKTLNDSKQLTALQRDRIYSELVLNQEICWAVDVTGPEEIDRLNILRASQQAMRRAVAALSVAPQHVLIDGLPVRPFPFPSTPIIAGDAKSYSIAAASIIAKVTRDRIMIEMDALYPGYYFDRHKGYGTALHVEKLKNYGPCPIHRRSFMPVAQRLFPFAC